jgi:hypothetical protein
MLSQRRINMSSYTLTVNGATAEVCFLFERLSGAQPEDAYLFTVQTLSNVDTQDSPTIFVELPQIIAIDILSVYWCSQHERSVG